MVIFFIFLTLQIPSKTKSNSGMILLTNFTKVRLIYWDCQWISLLFPNRLSEMWFVNRTRKPENFPYITILSFVCGCCQLYTYLRKEKRKPGLLLSHFVYSFKHIPSPAVMNSLTECSPRSIGCSITALQRFVKNYRAAVFGNYVRSELRLSGADCREARK